MSDQELRDLVASNHLALQQLIQTQLEDREQMRESERRFEREAVQRQQEAEQRQQESERKDEAFRLQMAELGKQIGGLGNRFGSFTESLILPSMARILYDEFGVDHVSIRTKAKREGGSLELDAFGYTNGTKNIAYVVEVKASIRKRDLDQILDILQKFPYYFPDHAKKHLFGIIAGLDAPDDVRQMLAQEGIFYADITDDVFRLDTPKEFVPRDFSRLTAQTT